MPKESDDASTLAARYDRAIADVRKKLAAMRLHQRKTQLRILQEQIRLEYCNRGADRIPHQLDAVQQQLLALDSMVQMKGRSAKDSIDALDELKRSIQRQTIDVRTRTQQLREAGLEWEFASLLSADVCSTVQRAAYAAYRRWLLVQPVLQVWMAVDNNLSDTVYANAQFEGYYEEIVGHLDAREKLANFASENYSNLHEKDAMKSTMKQLNAERQQRSMNFDQMHADAVRKLQRLVRSCEKLREDIEVREQLRVTLNSYMMDLSNALDEDMQRTMQRCDAESTKPLGSIVQDMIRVRMGVSSADMKRTSRMQQMSKQTMNEGNPSDKLLRPRPPSASAPDSAKRSFRSANAAQDERGTTPIDEDAAVPQTDSHDDGTSTTANRRVSTISGCGPSLQQLLQLAPPTSAEGRGELTVQHTQQDEHPDRGAGPRSNNPIDMQSAREYAATLHQPRKTKTFRWCQGAAEGIHRSIMRLFPGMRFPAQLLHQESEDDNGEASSSEANSSDENSDGSSVSYSGGRYKYGFGGQRFSRYMDRDTLERHRERRKKRRRKAMHHAVGSTPYYVRKQSQIEGNEAEQKLRLNERETHFIKEGEVDSLQLLKKHDDESNADDEQNDEEHRSNSADEVNELQLDDCDDNYVTTVPPSDSSPPARRLSIADMIENHSPLQMQVPELQPKPPGDPSQEDGRIVAIKVSSPTTGLTNKSNRRRSTKRRARLLNSFIRIKEAVDEAERNEVGTTGSYSLYVSLPDITAHSGLTARRCLRHIQEASAVVSHESISKIKAVLDNASQAAAVTRGDLPAAMNAEAAVSSAPSVDGAAESGTNLTEGTVFLDGSIGTLTVLQQQSELDAQTQLSDAVSHSFAMSRHVLEDWVTNSAHYNYMRTKKNLLDVLSTFDIDEENDTKEKKSANRRKPPPKNKRGKQNRRKNAKRSDQEGDDIQSGDPSLHDLLLTSKELATSINQHMGEFAKRNNQKFVDSFGTGSIDENDRHAAAGPTSRVASEDTYFEDYGDGGGVFDPSQYAFNRNQHSAGAERDSLLTSRSRKDNAIVRWPREDFMLHSMDTILQGDLYGITFTWVAQHMHLQMDALHYINTSTAKSYKLPITQRMLSELTGAPRDLVKHMVFHDGTRLVQTIVSSVREESILPKFNSKVKEIIEQSNSADGALPNQSQLDIVSMLTPRTSIIKTSARPSIAETQAPPSPSETGNDDSAAYKVLTLRCKRGSLLQYSFPRIVSAVVTD